MFFYILVSYTIAVSPWQCSDWYHQTANCFQDDVSCDYLWIVLYTVNSLCTGGSMHQQWFGKSQGHPIYISQDLSGIGNTFSKHHWRPHQEQIEKVATTISLCVSYSYTPIYFDPCDQLPHGHITLVCDVWLCNIHSPFFTMTITFDVLNWLFISKGGNRIHDFVLSFQLTLVMLEDKSVTTSEDPRLSLYIFSISCNGALFIWFALTFPVAATPISVKCLSKAGLAN